MIAVDKASRKNRLIAIIVRVEKIAATHGDSYFMVSCLFPVRHVGVVDGSVELAAPDPCLTAPSYYAGPDDALDDIANTAIKPDGLQPIAIIDWYPRFVADVQRRIDALTV